MVTTEFALIMKAADDEPEGIVTVVGRDAAAGLLFVRVTVTAETAVPTRLIVPIPDCPLMRTGGVKVSADRLTGGATVSVADFVTPLSEAEMSGVLVLVTARLVTENAALRPEKVIDDGTVAAEVSLLLRVTVTGNATVAVKVTVATLLVTPPSTSDGASVTDAGAKRGSSG